MTLLPGYAALVGRLERHLRTGRPLLVPAEFGGVWSAFRQLAGQRAFGPAGPEPIRWADLAAWQAVTGIELSGAQCAAVLALDAAFLAHAREGVAAADNPPPLTEEALDVILGATASRG